jgi:hypothetical protein
MKNILKKKCNTIISSNLSTFSKLCYTEKNPSKVVILLLLLLFLHLALTFNANGVVLER